MLAVRLYCPLHERLPPVLPLDCWRVHPPPTPMVGRKAASSMYRLRRACSIRLMAISADRFCCMARRMSESSVASPKDVHQVSSTGRVCTSKSLSSAHTSGKGGTDSRARPVSVCAGATDTHPDKASRAPHWGKVIFLLIVTTDWFCYSLQNTQPPDLFTRTKRLTRLLYIYIRSVGVQE